MNKRSTASSADTDVTPERVYVVVAELMAFECDNRGAFTPEAEAVDFAKSLDDRGVTIEVFEGGTRVRGIMIKDFVGEYDEDDDE